MEEQEAGGRSEPELRELVALAGRILHRLGLVDYLGHCSARVRDADRIVIKPRHSTEVRGMHSLGPSEMMVVDLDGEPVGGSQVAPTEVFIHTEIYRARPDVAAIVHTHQQASTLLGVIGAPLEPILHLPAAFLDTDVRTWSCPTLVTTPERGRELAAATADRMLCHLQGHGIVSLGRSVPEATVGAILFEQLADANLRVLQTGRSPRIITDDERETLRAQQASVAGRWAYYCQLVDDADGSAP